MLRVIGGKFKSRRIKEVKSQTTRPTTDKNKESLFNMLGQFFQGGLMLDLFAGSGAIGIEAISRGMDEVEMVENNFQAVKIIKENLNTLGIENQCKVVRQDVFSYLNTTLKKYNLIFADPPYALDKYKQLLDLINYRQLLADNGIIVMEADKAQLFEEKVHHFFKYKEHVLGNTKFVFYRMEEEI